MECYRCKTSLQDSDFEQGRAITLQDQYCCDACLPEAVKEWRQGTRTMRPKRVAATGSNGTRHETGTALLRRRHVRFAPPLECKLVLEIADGPNGGIDVARVWVDVSEGGLRAVVEGGCQIGDHFRGLVCHDSLKSGMEFQAEVRHAKPSVRLPNCLLVGLQFVSPAPELVSFIRSMLNLSQPDGDPPRPEGRPGTGRERHPSPAPLVLVVEDGDRMREMIVAALKAGGFRVLGVPTAKEGLRLARHGRPALILSDLELPDRDGGEAMRSLREDGAFLNVPVALISGLPLEALSQRASEVGAIGFLRKPFRPAEVVSAVREWLERAQGIAKDLPVAE